MVPAVYTSTLFLLLLDRTRALSAASSGHRKVDSNVFFAKLVWIFQGNGGTTRIKFLLIFLWIFHTTLCAPIIIGLVSWWSIVLKMPFFINNKMEITPYHILKIKFCIIKIIKEHPFSFPDEHQYLSGWSLAISQTLFLSGGLSCSLHLLWH